jgi:hypothetical protein
MKWQISRMMKSISWRVLAVSLIVLSMLMMAYPQPIEQHPDPSKKQTPQKKKPKLVKPNDPEAMALLVQLLERYAYHVENKDEMDWLVEKALAKRPGSRERMKRLVENFKKVPFSERQALLGSFADISTKTKIPKNQYLDAFKRAAKMTKPIPKLGPSDIEGDAKVPQKEEQASSVVMEESGHSFQRGPMYNAAEAYAYTPLSLLADEYRLTFVGLRCVDDTWGIGSDEIFVITTVIDADGHTWTTKHPQGGGFNRNSTYEADDGDIFQGPNRNVWHSNQGGGGAKDLTLIAWVWEEDSQNPEETAEAIRDWIEVAQRLCREYFGDDCPEWVIAVLNFIADNLLGLENDLIEKVERSISAQDIPLYIDGADGHGLQEYRGVNFHFRTRHNNGADYRVYFRFNRE